MGLRASPALPLLTVDTSLAVTLLLQQLFHVSRAGGCWVQLATPTGCRCCLVKECREGADGGPRVRRENQSQPYLLPRPATLCPSSLLGGSSLLPRVPALPVRPLLPPPEQSLQPHSLPSPQTLPPPSHGRQTLLGGGPPTPETAVLQIWLWKEEGGRGRGQEERGAVASVSAKEVGPGNSLHGPFPNFPPPRLAVLARSPGLETGAHGREALGSSLSLSLGNKVPMARLLSDPPPRSCRLRENCGRDNPKLISDLTLLTM